MTQRKTKMVAGLFLTGWVLMVLANVIGIGITLFLWGGQGLAIGLALWSAFKVWISIIGMGAAFITLAVTL